jgi:serine/threonine-protein kinase
MPNPTSNDSAADRNLLFGVLALQADLLDPDRFVRACTLWSAQKATPLADLLVQQGWLTPEDRSDVEKLLDRKLKKHQGDANAGLAEVTTDRVRQSLDGLTDPDIRQSMSATPPQIGHVLLTTTAYVPEIRERYTLSRLHASGGIGRVWLARDATIGRDVALKELRPERSPHPTVMSRFLKEAQITGQLEHPGIVPIYEVGVQPGNQAPFYTMRFVRGRTLAEAARSFHERKRGEAGLLEQRELLTAFVGVCNAVAYAHSRGVLHRDLKPQNVVLGGYGEVIVLDWGLARLLDQPESEAESPISVSTDEEADATIQGQVLGTPAYMAPEQAEGRLDRIGIATDVYGLGAILYEILTGSQPFSGSDTTALLRRVIHDDPAPPRSLAPDTPPALEAVCMKALAKNPPERYPSAKELVGDIQRWLADEPVSSYREPLLTRAARWVRRHRTLVGAAAAALIVAVGGLLAVAVVEAEGGRRLAAKNQELVQANTRVAFARDRAEARVDLALGAVASFRSAVDGNLDVKNRPENEALRKTLLQAPLAFYQKLRDDLKESLEVVPEDRAKLAGAYLSLATLDKDIGSQADALKAYDEAVDLLDPLTRDASALHRDALRMQLARALTDRGELQIVSSTSVPAALDSFGRAREILDPQAHAGDVASRLELARTLGDLANAEAKNGQVDAALATLRESLNVLEEVNRLQPDHIGAALQRANAHLQMSTILHKQRSQIPEALAAAESALRIVEPLAKTRPGNSECQLKLADVFEALGSLHESRSEVDKALSDYNKRLKVVDALVAANPAVTNYRYQRVLALSSVAASETDLGQNETALSTLMKARDLAAVLVRDNPTNLRYQRALGRTWNLTAGPQYALGKIPDAIASIEAYAAVLAEIHRADPGDLATLRGINGSHYNLGLLNDTLGRSDRALAAYDQSRRLLERLIKDYPDNTEFPFDLASTLGNVGTVQRNQRRFREAAESFGRAIEILKKLSTSHPENAQYESYLVRAQLNLGDVLTDLGRNPEAIAVLRSAHDAAERMAEEHPGVVQYQQDRADGLYYLEAALRKAGQSDEALATCKKGIEVYEAMLKSNPDYRRGRPGLAAFLREQGGLDEAAGRPGEAVKSYQRSITLFEGITTPSKFHLSELARCHARLAGLATVAGSGLPSETARKEADKSVEVLRRAVSAGFTDTELLGTNSDFDPVRQRDDFKKLLSELEAKAKPAK